MFVATTRNLYCIEKSKSTQLSTIHCIGQLKEKSKKTIAAQSEIGNFRRLQLQLELVCDEGDKLRIRGFALGIAEAIYKSLSPAGQEFIFFVRQIQHFDIYEVTLRIIVILHTALFVIGMHIINGAFEHNVQLTPYNIY